MTVRTSIRKSPIITVEIEGDLAEGILDYQHLVNARWNAKCEPGSIKPGVFSLHSATEKVLIKGLDACLSREKEEKPDPEPVRPKPGCLSGVPQGEDCDRLDCGPCGGTMK